MYESCAALNHTPANNILEKPKGPGTAPQAAPETSNTTTGTGKLPANFTSGWKNRDYGFDALHIAPLHSFESLPFTL